MQEKNSTWKVLIFTILIVIRTSYIKSCFNINKYFNLNTFVSFNIFVIGILNLIQAHVCTRERFRKVEKVSLHGGDVVGLRVVVGVSEVVFIAGWKAGRQVALCAPQLCCIIRGPALTGGGTAAASLSLRPNHAPSLTPDPSIQTASPHRYQ